MNIAQSLRLNAQSRPLHPAIIHGERVIVHRDLDGFVRRTAGWLAAQDIRRGDIVGVALGDTAEHLIAMFALGALGAVILPMDCRWTLIEQERIAAHFKAKKVLLEPDAPWGAAAPALRCDSEWQAGVAGQAPLPELAQGDALPLLLSLSSGTTGMAKGPLVTHQQFVGRFWAHWINLGLNAQSRYVSATPLYFGGGRTFALSQLFSGGTVCLFPPPYQPEQLVAEVRTRNATALFLVPTLLRRMLTLGSSEAPLMPSLTLLLSSGSPLHPEERRAIRRTITPHFFEMYATTEGGGVSLLTPDDQQKYSDSVGRAMFSVEVQVVGDDHQPIEPEQTGVLRYRSAGCATEFYGDHAATAEMFRNGWFYPGDMGMLNSEGYLFLKGRRKDLIIRGGVNIYPNEIEELLLRHPAVTEAAVLGLPSEDMGEDIAAFIIKGGDGNVGVDELIAHCRAGLAPYKTPRHFFFVDDMPKNSAGKILKAELAKMAPDLPRFEARR
jgi:acyl-CoA synthetase (AMP-forming)/AMP-acid ligase II